MVLLKKSFFLCYVKSCSRYCIHSYEMQIDNKVGRNQGCSVCAPNGHVKCCKCNNFMVDETIKKEFNVALELNKTITDKNGNIIDPYTIRPYSEMEFWFGCFNHLDCPYHFTKCKVVDRSDRTGCSFCVHGAMNSCPCYSFLNNPLYYNIALHNIV